LQSPFSGKAWEALFNGEDLNGWRFATTEVSKSATNQSWTVDSERSVLKCSHDDHNRLETIEVFEDFELDLQWRYTNAEEIGGNGTGIVVWSNGNNTRGQRPNVDPSGVEIDIRNPNQVAPRENTGTGALICYGIPASNALRSATGIRPSRNLNYTRKPKIMAIGDWNSCRVHCVGSKLSVWMNGELVNEATTDIPRSGRICLRNEFSTVEFRDIRIRRSRRTNHLLGDALRFDGVSDYVDIPTLKYDGAHPITVEAWATPSYGTEQHMIVIADGDDGKGFHLGTSQDNTRWRCQLYMQEAIGIEAPLTMNQRAHLALIINKTSATFFLNGQLVETQQIAYEASGKNIRIGALPSLGPYFAGRIDEVRISKGVRYTQDFTPSDRFNDDDNTLALYHFAEDHGDELRDSSGNRHHGKIIGAKWAKPDGSPIDSIGYALMFDGKNDYVEIEMDEEARQKLRNWPVTIEAFVMFGESTGVRQFICDTGDSPWISLFREDPRLENIADSWGTGRATSEGTWQAWHSLLVSPLRQGAHVAVVWDGQHPTYTANIFVNGKRRTTRNAAGNSGFTTPNTFSLLIGATHKRTDGSKVDHLRGMIRELRISSSARYDDDFQPKEHFDPDSNTIALYKFDSGAGNELRDSSGNRHHGRIVGAEWVKVSRHSAETE
jgi:hypothetical protein